MGASCDMEKCRLLSNSMRAPLALALISLVLIGAHEGSAPQHDTTMTEQGSPWQEEAQVVPESSSTKSKKSNQWEWHAQMPKADVPHTDEWRCRTMVIPTFQGHSGAMSITGWQATPTEPSAIHHQSLFLCGEPLKGPEAGIYPCKVEGAPCKGTAPVAMVGGFDFMSSMGKAMHRMFEFPQDVGLTMGGEASPYKYVVLQVHNRLPLKNDHSGFKLQIQPGLTPLQYGMACIAAGDFTVPPGKKKYRVMVRGEATGTGPPEGAFQLFAVRAHFHLLGRRAHIEQTSKAMAEKMQSWDHDFSMKTMMYRLPHPRTVQSLANLRGFCEYDSSAKTHPTTSGFDATQEMCNLWLMWSQPTSQYRQALAHMQQQ